LCGSTLVRSSNEVSGTVRALITKATLDHTHALIARMRRTPRLVALFHWTPAPTRFEWGGTAPGVPATIDDVRNAVLSGAIKGPNSLW
jgi:hypothetical protein